MTISPQSLLIGNQEYLYAPLKALEERGHDLSRLPFAHKILLENLLRRQHESSVSWDDIESIARWDAAAEPSQEIAYMPARVLLQDFTGVPAVVDLAAMRDAIVALGGPASAINPLQPAELVIDHSVQVDAYGSDLAYGINARKEFQRNGERYAFLRWGQSAFENFKVVPPETGIVHQVNLEYLARVVMDREIDGQRWLLPDTLVGTDSHTTMVNGLGVLGWGVGGIEAEAAMLGQPVTMLVPQVVGFRLVGALKEGATATDLVLRVVELLREQGVVGKFVEFFGSGLRNLPLADRATIANMAPEYGATCGIFPIDKETLRYLAFSGRTEDHIARVEAYAKAQGMFHGENSPEAIYSDSLELDLGTVEPALAGPKRPQDRIALGNMPAAFARDSAALRESAGSNDPHASVSTSLNGDNFTLGHGSVVIAAITSCTNTSNPGVMVAAGLLARNAKAFGLKSKPWVKTSLAPGSKVVTSYLEKAGLMDDLEHLGFHVVGYGCTTCIGNSGPLPKPVSEAIHQGNLVACSVLSGNRNFEGRIGPDIRANYLASPPLVVAYALAGRVDHALHDDPLGTDSEGREIFLKDIWPTQAEIDSVMAEALQSDMYAKEYADVFRGNETWRAIEIPSGDTYDWKDDSTYIRLPPYFEGMGLEIGSIDDIQNARVLAFLGDSVTTDHISPAGAIKKDGPAGKYLMDHGVDPLDFNSYGARRGNHEVMMRGTFANVRLRNKLVDREGGWSRHLPSGVEMPLFDAAMKYRDEGVSCIIIAGQEYGTGSSRDWAAKGPLLLGVRAVIAESYERIHRSNLVGMGILPLEFGPGVGADILGIDGTETYVIEGLEDILSGNGSDGFSVEVKATNAAGHMRNFRCRIRLDTPQEVEYYRHGGILQYVLRQLAG